MWTCARRDGAVGEAEEPPLAEPVEPVLGRKAERDPGHRARDLPVHVGVNEMGVQDARPVPGESLATSVYAIGSTSPRSRTSSSGTPRPRSSRANSQAPGSSSWSMRNSTSQPRARRSGRSWSRWASEPEMPATFCTCRTRPEASSGDPRCVENSACPRIDRVALLHALAELRPERGPGGCVECGELA